MIRKALMLPLFLCATAMMVALVLYPLENFDENTYHHWTSYNTGILPSAIVGGGTGLAHGYYAPSPRYSMGDWIPDPSVGLWYNIQGDAAGDQGTTTPFTLTNMPIHSILLPPTYTTTFTYPYALTNPANPYSYYKLLQVNFSQGYWGNFWANGHTSWYTGDINGGYLISNNKVDLSQEATMRFDVLKLPGGGGSGYIYMDYSGTSNNPAGPWTTLIGDGHQIQHSSGTWTPHYEPVPAVPMQADGTYNVYLLVRFRGNVTTGWANAPFQPQPNYWMDNFIIYTGEDPLPVELSSFTVGLSATNTAELSWVTQSESNVSGFRIYRNTASNLQSATMLNTFINASNTSQMQSYVYRDDEIYDPGTYYYWLQSLDFDGSNQFYGPVSLNLTLEEPVIPPIEIVTGISGVYPNPFYPSLCVDFDLEKAANVRVDVFDIRGRLVQTVLNTSKALGRHHVSWDGCDDMGNQMDTGLYSIRLTCEGKNYIKKVTLLK